MLIFKEGLVGFSYGEFFEYPIRLSITPLSAFLYKPLTSRFFNTSISAYTYTKWILLFSNDLISSLNFSYGEITATKIKNVPYKKSIASKNNLDFNAKSRAGLN